MSFLFKVILILLLLFIVINLAIALVRMVRAPSSEQSSCSEQSPDSEHSTSSQKGTQRSMSYYLGRRVMISAFVVILILIALMGGFIEPNSRPY
ncbi:DUF2909 family protein [Vibrio genomosp. F10]|uniref:DUF2909 domain-containing protein n=2 Tax=Vibrio genomosp. F10 TaxID=723171 RepID=A0A1B9R2P5_9VIBR|nr:DUF2909 family protein [Vibrio genomosp. F10]OCH78445.1 hypothetical protein A6E14_04620 [Vibrio genomosp. F10]OEE30842.1 hypothetical protein A1QO_16075 [Vibrio genomosp. F10 str. ZF-129]OEE98069.1 hypothetical protein A1QM_02365 [Vibrio genomosp. F10 str. 9ZC157]OEF05342.1 hypothetical protein A1QI_08240 [Vibrio genomosp. F10 str. 9ZB36]OEF06856.1 hypothetical protein A1QK_07620 [Vibrio genomosp. F10 str. 9ZD137]